MMSGNDDQEFFRSVDDQVFNDFSLSLIHFLSILILFSFFSFGVPAIFFQILLSSTSAGLLLIKLFCFCMSLRSIIRRIIPIKLRYEGKVKGGTNLNRGKVHRSIARGTEEEFLNHVWLPF